jgi:uncharacterized protein (TIGR03000 family)
LFSRRGHHGHHGCNGCDGCYGCNGYGCNGCFGCAGVSYGCNGGCFGCNGCAACAGCDGGEAAPAGPGAPKDDTMRGAPPKIPAAKPDGKKPGGKREENKDESQGPAGPAPATIVVTLPAEARLTIDGQATTSTSATRVFVTPDLTPDREFHYTFKAEWVVDGRPVVATKKVTITAGNRTAVTIGADSVGVASR